MSTKLPLIRGQMATLTEAARDLFHEIGIHVKRTKNIKVTITQHCTNGTSFTFMTHEKEYHLPAWMVNKCFAETTGF